MSQSKECHRAGFGFVGPTCKSRGGLRPSPRLTRLDCLARISKAKHPLEVRAAEVARNNVFGSPNSGNRRRSQTALPSDRLGCPRRLPDSEVTVRGCWVIVDRAFPQDKSG